MNEKFSQKVAVFLVCALYYAPGWVGIYEMWGQAHRNEVGEFFTILVAIGYAFAFFPFYKWARGD